MTCHSLRRLTLLCGAVVMLLGAPWSSAHADVFRATVVVDKKPGVPRRLAELEVDSLARAALAEAFISSKMSPSLLTLRRDQVRTALAPVETLMQKFSVVTREDADTNRVRVVCEAEIDAAGIVLRLVNNKVLTFGQEPPRVLLTAAAGTRAEVVQALRGRIADTLGSAGISLLAAEMTGVATSLPGHWFHPDVVRKAAIDSRADFVAIVGTTGARAPSLVGGVVFDATVQYTLMRPHDAAIVAEQVFTERGSGTSLDLAWQMVLDLIAPRVASGLSGRLAEAIFANGSVIDPDVAPRNLTVNVFYRPSEAATSALMALLRDRGMRASLGTGRVGPTRAPISTPADQVIVEGPATIERLYDLFANTGFGKDGMLRASVFEYDDEYIGIEIVDRTPPKVPPVRLRPKPVAEPTPVEARAATAAPVTAPPPVTNPTGASLGIVAASSAKPLEFRLSAAFARAVGDCQE